MLIGYNLSSFWCSAPSPVRALQYGPLRGHGARTNAFGRPVSYQRSVYPRWRLAMLTLVTTPPRACLLPFACSGRLTPISKRCFGSTPGLAGGTEALQSYGSRHQRADLWAISFAITLKQVLGGWPRPITAFRCDQVAGHLHSRGACSAGGWLRALSLAPRTAPWETQWGQLDRSFGGILAWPAKLLGGWGGASAPSLPVR